MRIFRYFEQWAEALADILGCLISALLAIGLCAVLWWLLKLL
jgi:hypothetical protein